ncbi:MAG: ABC-type vitamin B12 transporter [Pantoea stewartii]|uniref:vitamin B12 ABC transporter ATP-binding protein BtuD n=1 Tax=Pantoea stewartii TaxID=66269 RepID=UPI0006D0D774|nr:vitamin B12 ABC transporter ATP-binding protein BtuD [Pantoea stewartii]WHT00978.1 MAG: ABC-type vitamin B12 transporter [Pantoea stewartii]
MLLSLQAVAVAGRLQPVSGALHAGHLIHLVGPNGAGKSTLLSALAGLEPITGQMTLQDKALADWPGPALARVRGWLPQQQLPPGMMPVYHYLRLHLASSGPHNDARLMSLLARLQLTEKLSRPLNQLSGGEWQRVRLCAVMAQIDPQINADGKLLILDEPMTALDVAQQHAVDNLIQELCRAGVCVIASSHDLNHSLWHADRVWLLHQGAVVAQGKPCEVLRPEQLTPLYGIPFRQLILEGRPLLTVLP